jgi:cyclase
MSAHAHDITTPGPPRLEEVSDGIWAYVQPDGTWWINNTGAAVGPQGVIAIDSCSTERRTRAFAAAIGSVTAAPVRTLVNTHHHGDHTWGNGLFSTATIVAHKRAREEMLAFGPPGELPFWHNPDWGSLPFDPPFLTFTDGVELHLGDLRAEVRHVGTPAHTTNDSLVWFPERSTLFCGDLIFNGGTPFLLMGSVAGAMEVLENVVAPLGATTTVPGHGPVFHDPAPWRRPWTTYASSSTSPTAAGPRASPRCRPPATPTSAPSPTGPTPSGSSATCTAPTPNWTARNAARRSTSWPPSATWSPTTADSA